MKATIGRVEMSGLAVITLPLYRSCSASRNICSIFSKYKNDDKKENAFGERGYAREWVIGR
jgi:hypothetical protein